MFSLRWRLWWKLWSRWILRSSMNWNGRSPRVAEKPMDREVVFVVLVAALCGGALIAAGSCWPAASVGDESGPVSERESWRRIWLPFGPAAFVFALLCGWL